MSESANADVEQTAPEAKAPTRGGTRGARRPGQSRRAWATSFPDPSRRLESTRERILYVTSVLLAARGYRGTSTRDIGRAVGIQAPSLYHHFESKEAIVEELLSHSLDLPAAFARRMVKEDADPAVKLFRYVRFDHMHLCSSVLDLRGVHNEYVLSRPRFARWNRRFEELRSDIRTLIKQGIGSGRFVDVHPLLAQDAISGLVIRVFAGAAQRPPWQPCESEAAASFVLRALLVDPGELEAVKKGALEHRDEDDRLLCQVGIAEAREQANAGREASEMLEILTSSGEVDLKETNAEADEGLAQPWGRLTSGDAPAVGLRAGGETTEHIARLLDEKFKRLEADLAQQVLEIGSLTDLVGRLGIEVGELRDSSLQAYHD
jgi:AcrR family transcriptional regulator